MVIILLQIIQNLSVTLSPKHESEVHSPCWFDPNNTEDLQGYSAMQAPLLNRRGHHKTTEEEEIGFKKVLRAYRLGRKYPQCWEKPDWKHCSDGQGKGLCAPKNGHQHHHIKTFSLLQRKKLNTKLCKSVGTSVISYYTWKNKITRGVCQRERKCIHVWLCSCIHNLWAWDACLCITDKLKLIKDCVLYGSSGSGRILHLYVFLYYYHYLAVL